MAGLLGIEDAAHRGDRLGRGHALRLVQDDPAMDRDCPSCDVPSVVFVFVVVGRGEIALHFAAT